MSNFDIDTFLFENEVEGMGIDSIAENMKSFFGEENVRFVDEKIDDSLDDGDYLMMRSYDIKDSNNNEYHVRFYYCQSSRKVSCYDTTTHSKAMTESQKKIIESYMKEHEEAISVSFSEDSCATFDESGELIDNFLIDIDDSGDIWYTPLSNWRVTLPITNQTHNQL